MADGPEIAAQLGVHHTTAKRFAREGVLRAVRADDGASMLFEPLTGPAAPRPPGEALPRPPPLSPVCIAQTEGAAV